jgi:hypothetical protein
VGGVVAIYTVECDGKLIKQFKAADFMEKDQTIIFFDEQSETVGAVVKKPGMTVVKQGHEHRDSMG